MIRPKLSKVASGTRLTTDLVNDIINRTEYAADLLRQYKLIAGTEMYIEPHYDGTRVSYLQPVGGGTTPSQGQGQGLGFVVTLRSAGMDSVETLTWSISGTVSSASLSPFTGQSQTSARMSGQTITNVGGGVDNRFILVINGSNLNNFSIVLGGGNANGQIVDVTFQKPNGTSFKFSNFCGTQQSSIGQVEAFGICRFYDGGVGGGPPGIPFNGVGNYWIKNPGESMTFKINT
jgi:hypothetical protein